MSLMVNIVLIFLFVIGNAQSSPIGVSETLFIELSAFKNYLM